MAKPLLTWPLPLACCHRITQRYGERPAYYRQFGLQAHNGLDFGVPVGTTVMAADDGVVLAIRVDLAGFGLYIKLRHAWGNTLYAHLSETYVQIGDRVRRGERIGASGNSGYSTGPHLHFGVQPQPVRWRDGWNGYADPLAWLPALPSLSAAMG